MRPIHLLILLSCLPGITSCGLNIPTRVSPTVTKNQQPVVLSDETLITLGPRRLLEEISQGITERNHDIEVIDGLLFRDTAFPNGGWTLKQLLTPVNCHRVYDLLQVDYLVLVGRIGTEHGESGGFFLPLVVGAIHAENTVKLSATLFDLKRGKLSCQVYSEAQGKERVFAYVILVVGNTPQILTAATEGLAEGIINEINALKKNRKIRIAVMAAENPIQVKTSIDR